MTVGNLFNGIGGFALAAAWMKWENIMHCEIDPFCNRVMKHHFPNSFQHEDIRTTDFRIWGGKIDLITGGFPCQPFSTAGYQVGIDDDRYLWPEMLGAVKQIKPRWVVAENVYGIINWNGGWSSARCRLIWRMKAMRSGRIFFRLAVSTPPTDATGFGLLPTILASSSDRRGGTTETDNGGWESGKHVEERCEVRNKSSSTGECRTTTNPERLRQPGQGWTLNAGGTETSGDWKASWAYDDGRWPTESPVCNRNDGLSAGLVDITFSKWRNESLKALGNAIVPQIAYEIFKAIEQYEQ